MSETPAATKNSSMPMIKPLVDCVTMQESDVTQLAKAGKSKHHLDPDLYCRCD